MRINEIRKIIDKINEEDSSTENIREDVRRLEDISDEIIKLAKEAVELIRNHDPGMANLAERGWKAHVIMAMDHNSGYNMMLDSLSQQIIKLDPDLNEEDSEIDEGESPVESFKNSLFEDMSDQDRAELIDDLEEIKENIIKEADEALEKIGGFSEEMEEIGRTHWYGALMMALDNNHGYLGGQKNNLQDQIDAIKEYDPDEEY